MGNESSRSSQRAGAAVASARHSPTRPGDNAAENDGSSVWRRLQSEEMFKEGVANIFPQGEKLLEEEERRRLHQAEQRAEEAEGSKGDLESRLARAEELLEEKRRRLQAEESSRQLRHAADAPAAALEDQRHHPWQVAVVDDPPAASSERGGDDAGENDAEGLFKK